MTALPDMVGAPSAGEANTAAGRIFTIPQTAPFLDTLAHAILAGKLPRDGGEPPSPAALADTLIYLPNRAACRAMAGAFLRASGNGVTLLPRMRPLGSAEEDALLLLAPPPPGDDAVSRDLDRPDLPLPPAVGALERRMVLTQLILAWARRLRQDDPDRATMPRVASTPAAAVEMALDLIRLIDEAETEDVDLREIRELLPERFAEHEQLSLSFLEIVVDTWPNYLADTRRLNPVARRNGIMALEVERLRALPPDTPVIVAGSTGSIPATAALMRAVMELPRGAIVLPGLDMMLDAESWRVVAQHPEHPQAGLHQLLAGLGATREHVASLRGAEEDEANATAAKPETNAHRLAFLSEAMRPASTMGAWPRYIDGADRKEVAEGLAGVSLVVAPTEQDEAAAIAMILRETAEVPDKTAALVTPDSTLARRVSAELMRWGLTIGGTTGEPLRSTPAGIFFDLIAEFAATGSQIALLGLLKHPLTRAGLPEGHTQRAAKLLEIAGMRQTWCGNGLDELSRSLHLAQKIKPRHPAIDLFSDDDWTLAGGLLHRLRESMWPLTQLARGGAVPFAEMAKAHAAVAEALLHAEETAQAEDGTPLPSPSHSGTNASCVQLSVFMGALTSDTPAPTVTLADYPALFRSLIRLERMPPTPPAHPRLRILTPMEARTAAADLVIAAGLNEGSWPASAAPGPWLNRAMRASLGLPPPERNIRLAAHDFAQILGAREVVLTRALKSDGAPTVPSRWLMRMEALLQGLGLDGILEPKRPWLTWATARNAMEMRPVPPAPAPCPPLASRPRRLSVSAIETLIANPYAIFARHILGLIPLPPLESEPENSDRGRLIHETLHHFARRYEADLPPAISAELMDIFDDRARLYDGHARVAAFWRPRLERFARWFAETETARRNGARVFSEVRGELTILAPGGPFMLTARADRIDLRPDGTVAIYDYKSATMPGEKAVTEFRSPQLPLEALIASEGYFNGLGRRAVAKLAYISARGGDPAGDERPLEKVAPDALAKAAREGLAALIARFDAPETPYAAMRRAAFANGYKYDDYAHLARVAEWMGAATDGEG